ncbi:MAG: YjjG family noncanonical pyrimidine nucleotidase [Bacteroidales bacterium]|nr:YjjG family noncanonical pyrimidine nucleotidase [Bacteroidales bacterium]MDD3200897.1 YjjG family noncanonical pyrimidine nucleotidase [Bacteroidales bacterium]
MIIDRYNFFLFDIDRTLWDFDTNAAVAMHAMLNEFQIDIGSYDEFISYYEVINHHLWDEYEAGRITKEYLRRERFYQTLKNNYGKDDLDLSERMGNRYLEYMALGKALMPGALDLLRAIQSKGGKMAIVSNGFREVQYRKMEVSGIANFFSAVMISDEIGVHKPHPAIFKKAMEAIGGGKKETLMVGDDYRNDIEGAQIFGIDQFYYNPNNIPSDKGATYESSDLWDLIRL